MKNVGSFKSGRKPGSGRYLVEKCLEIDVVSLHAANCLRAGWIGDWKFTRDGETIASIRMQAEGKPGGNAERLRLAWGTARVETVPIVWVRCHYGGNRPYFQCPGLDKECGSRLNKLYRPGTAGEGKADLFLCRKCQSLGYASQVASDESRMRTRAMKAAIELGVIPGSPLPPRPPGMYRPRYERLCAEVRAAEAAWLDSWGKETRRLAEISASARQRKAAR